MRQPMIMCTPETKHPSGSESTRAFLPLAILMLQRDLGSRITMETLFFNVQYLSFLVHTEYSAIISVYVILIF